MLAVYTITIFLSAVLLFVVQPMFARMIVPLLGGSPSVWNTAMLFYQATLLAGYAYAHFGTKLLGLRRQIILHIVLLALVFVALPLGVPDGWSPPRETNPVYWLLALMGLSVGLPFFVLSSTSPLIQKWFASTGHRSASDPYFLYAASNAGSLLALGSYPFVIEPLIGLGMQSRLWSAGYALLAVLIGACAFLLWKSLSESKPAASEVDEKVKKPAEQIGRWRKARWVALAFVPSSLMLSLTTYLSSEVASAPLLWIFPLTLYLLTFTLVFARRRLISHSFLLRMFPIGVIALTLLLTMRATNPFFLLALVHLGMFFVAAMVCHGEIANDRPDAEHLTEFYLWMSIGGVFGGIFNALVAPLVFNSIAEYPLVIVAACFLVVKTVSGEANRFRRRLDFALPIALAGLTFILIYSVPRLAGVTLQMAHALIFAPPALACFFLSERRVRFSVGVALIFAASGFYAGETGKMLFSDRSFYGVHRVTLDPDGDYHLLIHGTTVHGMQSVEREEEPIPHSYYYPTPLSYYHPTGPAGEFFFIMRNRLDGPVAAIGMGVGALAAYGKEGQAWTFYEIDPVVVELAKSSDFFDYYAKSRATLDVVLGDGRLSLGTAPDGKFHLIIVDAFSSDVIPIHLLTREALALYVQKLRPDGVILFHISNRHFDLKPILANLSLDAGLICLHRDGTYVPPTPENKGKDPSEWIVIARRDADVGAIAQLARWHRFREQTGDVVWTDDLASLLDVLF
jgi:SAM-dependent methyltransferase